VQQKFRSSNRFLQSLSIADFELLAPHLRTVELKRSAVLFETGGEIDRIYLPLNGAISLVVPLGGGEMVEAGMIGRDGIVGSPAALDSATAVNQAMVQVDGQAAVVGVPAVQAAVRHSLSLRNAVYQYDQMLLIQAQQSAACNVAHDATARLCRWMLRARDLSGSDTLPFTQEFLAEMLGVQRTTVSPVAHTLQAAGMIQYKRGKIHILDVEGLRESACECYTTVKKRYEELVGGKMPP